MQLILLAIIFNSLLEGDISLILKSFSAVLKIFNLCIFKTNLYSPELYPKEFKTSTGSIFISFVKPPSSVDKSGNL